MASSGPLGKAYPVRQRERAVSDQPSYKPPEPDPELWHWVEKDAPPPHAAAGTSLERASRWILVSEEVLEQLSKDWSPPVEVMIAKDDERVLELTLRTHTCPDPPLTP